MALIVVESPTKARTFNRILKSKEWGEKYFVFATVGHFRDLPAQSLAVDLSHHFQPEYEIMDKKKNMVEKLRALAKEHDEVILATDPDREGESISYHVAYILGYIKEQWPDFTLTDNTLKRIIFHEITPKALEEALGHPEHLRVDLVKAQQARRVLDRLVGYQISPLLWKKTGKRWLSAGRVQTVALRLIVEREKEILKFTTEPYVQLTGVFENGQELKAKLISKDGVAYESSQSIQLFDGNYSYTSSSLIMAQAEVITPELKSDNYTVEKADAKEAKRYPPPPFTTSLLQQDSFQKLGYPSKLTMRLAQSLYEKGLITYHRTDSFNLSTKFVFSAKEFIEKKFGKEYALEKPRAYRTKSKSAQEAHEAIRPTQAARTLTSIEGKKLSEQEKKLYELIFNRAIATQMKESSAIETRIEIVGTKGYVFETTSVQVIFDGFMKILMPQYAQKHTEPTHVTAGTRIDLKDILTEQKETKPPYRYNEASLIRALEEKGIGRPSTYASIISLIIDKHYVEKEHRAMKPTILGQAMCEYLAVAFPDLFTLGFTAEMEDRLDEIANGERELLKTIEDFYTPLEVELKKQNSGSDTIAIAEDVLEEPCPQCGKKLVARYGKFGKFYACSGFPSCKYIKPNLHFVKNRNCPLCNGRLVVRYSKKGKRFYGCENYPKCTHIQWALNVPAAEPAQVAK